MSEFLDLPSDLQNSYFGLVALHLREALIPVLAGLLVALPVAQLCVRVRWLYAPVLWVTTVLYAIPSLAFFVILIDYTGLSELTVMIPLAVYSLVVLVPAIIAGLRVATVSSISLVSVGMLIGNQGALGNLLHDAQIYNRPELTWNSVITTALLAILVDALLVLVRVLLTPWMPSGTAGRKQAPALKDAAR